MFVLDKKSKFLYHESDDGLRSSFELAGFGVGKKGSMLFHPLEAAYLAKIGKSSFGGESLEEFLAKQKKKDASFPFAFEVYCKIRSTGRLVRMFSKKANYFRAYAPGVGREEERPSQLVALLPGSLSAKSIAQEVKIAHSCRLELIIATGKVGAIQFYKVSAFNF